MAFQFQNLYRNFSFLQLNAANLVVGNNVAPGAIVQVHWVDPAAGTANLLIPARGMFVTINGANQVVGDVNPQLLQLDVQGNGSYIIHAVGNDIQRLVLNDIAGPITNDPAPLVGAPDFNKQFWMLVAAP